MRITDARLSVRLSMLIVSAIAVLCWGTHLYAKRSTYLYMARYHGVHERSSVIGVIDGGRRVGRGELGELTKRWVAYHADLRAKYERAASSPWSRVAPDPPSPVPLSGPNRSVDLNYHD